MGAAHQDRGPARARRESSALPRARAARRLLPARAPVRSLRGAQGGDPRAAGGDSRLSRAGVAESGAGPRSGGAHRAGCDARRTELRGRGHARARGMLEAEAKRLDPSRTWREQIIEARTRHPERTELRDAYVQETERALRFVRERHIAPVLSTALEITDTPVFQRAFTPYSAY